MKRLTILIPAYLVPTLSGCAVYNGVSMSSQIITQKSIPEHVASGVTGADCSAWTWLTDNRNHSYLCEVRDVSKTYNRTAY